MKKEFIPYDQALELKELGFNEDCIAFYNPSYIEMNGEILYGETGHFDNWNKEVHLISAPLYQQAFRWFREKYQLQGYVGSYGFEIVNTNKYMDILSSGFYSEIYEESELACLKKLIEIAKNK